MKFSQRIIDLMNREQITQTELAKRIGKEQSTISLWLNSSKIKPPVDCAIKIAKILHTSVDYLFNEEDIDDENAIYTIINGVVQKDHIFPSSIMKDIVFIPFYEGSPDIDEEVDEDEYIGPKQFPVPRGILRTKKPDEVRVLKIYGESMENVHLMHGDFIFFKPPPKHTNKPDGLYIIKLKGKILIKFLEFDWDLNKVWVQSKNDWYASRTFQAEGDKDLEYVGTVIGWYTKHNNLTFEW